MLHTDKPTWRRHLPAAAFLVLASLLYFRSTVFRAPHHLDAAKLDLQTLAGHPIPAAKLQGKAIILNFWAPWCGPCLREMPALQKLQAAHPTDLLVLGVVEDADTYAEAALFTSSHGITYPILKKSGALTTTVGTLSTIPLTFFLDRSGNVTHTVTGGTTITRMEQYAAEALAR